MRLRPSSSRTPIRFCATRSGPPTVASSVELTRPNAGLLSDCKPVSFAPRQLISRNTLPPGSSLVAYAVTDSVAFQDRAGTFRSPSRSTSPGRPCCATTLATRAASWSSRRTCPEVPTPARPSPTIPAGPRVCTGSPKTTSRRRTSEIVTVVRSWSTSAAPTADLECRSVPGPSTCTES